MVPNPSPGVRGSRRREAERKLRRELILEAAERVFARRPFHQATMTQIAAEAELGMHGIYEHFGSKEALYEAVVLRRAHRFLARIEAIMAEEPGPLERLRAVARLRAETFFEAPAYQPVFLTELLRLEWGLDSRVAPGVQGVIREVRKRVEGVMAEAIEAGLLARRDPAFLVRVFMGTLTAALATEGPGAEGERIGRCVDLAMDVFLEGASRR